MYLFALSTESDGPGFGLLNTTRKVCLFYTAQLNQSFITFILPFKTTHSIKYFQTCYGQKSNFSEHISTICVSIIIYLIVG